MKKFIISTAHTASTMLYVFMCMLCFHSMLKANVLFTFLFAMGAVTASVVVYFLGCYKD